MEDDEELPYTSLLRALYIRNFATRGFRFNINCVVFNCASPMILYKLVNVYFLFFDTNSSLTYVYYYFTSNFIEHYILRFIYP